MTSRKWWLDVSVYVSIVLLALGLMIIGLSFTKIPRKTFKAIKNKLNLEDNWSRRSSIYSTTSFNSLQEYNTFHKSLRIRTSIDIDIPYPNRKELQDLKLSQEQEYLVLKLTKVQMNIENIGTEYKSSQEYKQLIKDVHEIKRDIEYTDEKIRYEEFKATYMNEKDKFINSNNELINN